MTYHFHHVSIFKTHYFPISATTRHHNLPSVVHLCPSISQMSPFPLSSERTAAEAKEEEKGLSASKADRIFGNLSRTAVHFSTERVLAGALCSVSSSTFPSCFRCDGHPTCAEKMSMRSLPTCLRMRTSAFTQSHSAGSLEKSDGVLHLLAALFSLRRGLRAPFCSNYAGMDLESSDIPHMFILTLQKKHQILFFYHKFIIIR